jgi:hypothetical protein
LDNNIKMDVREIGLEGVDWIYLAQDRNAWQAVVNTVMNHRVLCKAGHFLSSRTTVSFSRRSLLHRVSQKSAVTAVVHKSNAVSFLTKRSNFYVSVISVSLNTDLSYRKYLHKSIGFRSLCLTVL